MTTIKAYTSYNERTNKRFYRNFELIGELPCVGEVNNDLTVKDIYPAYLDSEQDSEEVYDYDFFEVEEEREDGETFNSYVCVVKPENVITK